jgi:Mlc titration factor MtfA (ptsG expression regulator)
MHGDPDSSCMGFYFTCYAPDRRGRAVEVEPDEAFQRAEDAFLDRLQAMLAGRLDLLNRLSCLPEAMEVRLHAGTQFYDWQEQVHFYGRVTQDGDHLVLELAVEQILQGCSGPYDALDVVVHEVMHVLDYLDDDDDGELTNWDEPTRARFRRVRAEEQRKLADGTSVLDDYGATSDVEFLAVAGESFFVEPDRLLASSPELYRMLADYFRLDPAADRAA